MHTVSMEILQYPAIEHYSVLHVNTPRCNAAAMTVTTALQTMVEGDPNITLV